jgi:hypothetical protein
MFLKKTLDSKNIEPLQGSLLIISNPRLHRGLFTFKLLMQGSRSTTFRLS